MTKHQFFTVKTSLIVALGGFLMGFDASVISGVIRFIEPEFQLSKVQIGWAVSSLTLTSTLAMLIAGPISERYGRKIVLKWAALFYAFSAIGSALATSFTFLVLARMLGGFGVGASLIIAPMYIAEMSPAKLRGRMVSFNQLNIVLGISIAFFTNYLIFRFSQSGHQLAISLLIDEQAWRYMLGLETIPAVVYFLGLFLVPESPRWLVLQKRESEALEVFCMVGSKEQAKLDLNAIKEGLNREQKRKKIPLKELFHPSLRLVLIIGITVAILQQITGINSVFFYAPMIFEQSGIGADAAFVQATLVGLTNFLFTILAMLLIDRLGRKLLLIAGLSGIAISMFVLSYGFNEASYCLTQEHLGELSEIVDTTPITPMVDIIYSSDIEFKSALKELVPTSKHAELEALALSKATSMKAWLILAGILAFVASFAISIGPVMWVLFSEIFPNHIRGLAISFVGFINSGVSFLVQLLFPWELETIGSANTFLIYGLFAAVGVFIMNKILPETKNKTLEELENLFIHK